MPSKSDHNCCPRKRDETLEMNSPPNARFRRSVPFEFWHCRHIYHIPTICIDIMLYKYCPKYQSPTRLRKKEELGDISTSWEVRIPPPNCRQAPYNFVPRAHFCLLKNTFVEAADKSRIQHRLARALNMSVINIVKKLF